MEHRHLNKDKLFTVTDIDGITGFNHSEVPIFVVLSLKRVDPLSGTIDWCIGDLLHQSGEGTTVVHLTVVGNDEIDLF